MGSRLEDIRTYGLGRPAGHDEAFVRGLSPTMLTLESVIGDIARTNIPVLVVGESGSGKQMFAQRIHLLSLRADEEMAKVACASMKVEEFSAELESHGRRAVGTVLFDEISELDAACQRYLLHSLPDGDEHPRPKTLTARVISTTSRNLDEEMCAGTIPQRTLLPNERRVPAFASAAGAQEGYSGARGIFRGKARDTFRPTATSAEFANAADFLGVQLARQYSAT